MLIRLLKVVCIWILAQSCAFANQFDRCMLEQMAAAPDSVTVGELRSICLNSNEIADGLSQDGSDASGADYGELTLTQRSQLAQIDLMERKYTLTTHYSNYIMATTNSKTNQEFAQEILGKDAFDNQEVKWQVSFKLPVIRDFIRPDNDILFGFTTTAWWQVFNSNRSRPVRDTNYQPEFFWRHYGGPKLLGGQVTGFDFGYVHESNGRSSEELSRSWDRMMFRTELDYDELVIALRTWYRFKEDRDTDDNPSMHRYYGYGDITASWAPNKNTFTAMLRPGTDKNGMELTWSYPINKILRIYAQYYSGYGESLLDYDKRMQRFGLGIAINDRLQR